MLRAGIESDSVLIAEANAIANDGDIIIAKLATGWTLKRVFFKNGYKLLMPDSDDHNPMIVKDNEFFEIAGVVRACISNV